ncbi:uncharacterized protein BCR38DRAFT_456398 [Pseudomassariella vexata]|uniref:Thioredoxin domain-containing protein n=1 Tax=Pseudomassariella vexata TaxID=1141098 RepID=A0A1Y2E822_9PEZI|nr:uncharacterized protein BCR38DRAFT_456398 [Pseudomassariella vexata]ORY67723.1 hypothetical protein BCR38DRAFT_456398 [Pseudomassariella vexata]
MRPSTIRTTLSPFLKGTGTVPANRSFSASRQLRASNIKHAAVRRPDELQSYLLLSASTRKPLITLWTASYCPTCRVVEPLVQEVIESGIGEAEGGVNYCIVEYDSPDIMADGMGMTYMISSMPTLLSFDAQEAQTATKITDARKLGDREFLQEWIRTEARRGGNRGGGGGGGGVGGMGLLGGLFGSWRK